MPIVVEGSAAAWESVTQVSWDLAKATIPLTGAAAIAGVVGRPSNQLERCLGLFDLEVFGTPEEVARQLDGWIYGFVRWPQACTISAQLLRQPADLTLESLGYSTLQSGPEHSAWLRLNRYSPITDRDARVSAAADGRYREVVLTRPRRHNAFDSQMREELCDVLDAFATESGTSIGIRALGPSFCSGGDLAEFGTRSDPVHSHIVRTSRSVAERMDRLGARIAVAVHGKCIGAGVELPAFAARVIAAPDTTFQLPEATLGLLPGAGGTVSIKRRIGRRRLLDLIVTGRQIDAPTALAWGLIDEIVEPSRLPSRLREVSQALVVSNDPVA
jgi:enoyl-CoA hydratase/carnithine racemase